MLYVTSSFFYAMIFAKDFFFTFCLTFYFFFFFQAEDGIRDYKVTGVQTCALPICDAVQAGPRAAALGHRRRDQGRRRGDQIGRASCRERVESWGGAGSLKKKKNKWRRRAESGK